MVPIGRRLGNSAGAALRSDDTARDGECPGHGFCFRRAVCQWQSGRIGIDARQPPAAVTVPTCSLASSLRFFLEIPENTMDCPIFPQRSGRALLRGAALALVLGLAGPGLASDRGFPFGREMFLDSGPIGKSRKIPSLEVGQDGLAAIDLYCASGQGQVTVTGDTISIVPGPLVETQCTPDRLRGDDDLLAALTAATTWRRDGEALVLLGPKTLRYLPATH
jgi:META domain-containing protein